MTSGKEPIDVKKNTSLLSSQEQHICTPMQLMEVNQLLNSINRRLEDCALEWQSEISRKQWKIFNSKAAGGSLIEQSLLARTYFTEKDLDEAFQHLLSCSKIFSEYLRNFIARLQGEQPILTIKDSCDAQNQCSDPSKHFKSSDAKIEPLHLSPLMKERSTKPRGTKNLINNILSIQNSFVDVIKAKVDFDTKFLGFEAVLHKTASASTDVAYFCQYCSNVTPTTNEELKRMKNQNVNQKGTKIKRKRLTRSTRTLAKRKGKKPSIPAGDMGDQPLIITNRSYKDSFTKM